MKKTAYLVIAYASCVFLGGLMGLFIAGSVPSLVAGVGFGSLILINGIKILKGNIKGLQLALVQSLVLGSFFTYRLQVTQKIMPAVPMLVMSFLLSAFLVYKMPKKQKSN